MDPQARAHQGLSLSRDFGWIAVTYMAAGSVAVLVGGALSDWHPIAVVLVADVAATVAVFAFSLAFRNSSFYDPYWSVAPPVIAVYWIFGAEVSGASGARQLLVFALVVVWATRLTWNWARGWGGLGHEDWRYVDLKRQHGRRYWLVSFAGIHLAPTLWVFGGCLPLYAAVTGTGSLGWLDAVAFAVTVGSIAIEGLADEELRAFRRGGSPPGAILKSGLWAWSRHPNYFGEMGFWWGLWLFGLAADAGWWWTAVGPVAITLMFRYVSLPMIEERMRARRPGWEEHAARTALVIPRPPRPGV